MDLIRLQTDDFEFIQAGDSRNILKYISITELLRTI